MKVAKSCRQCRAAKRKCTFGPLPHSACSLCAQKGFGCSLIAGQESNRPKLIAPATKQPEQVSDGTRDQLIDTYLKLLHDKPHSFFQPETLKRRVQAGSLPEATLFSILALAARLSDDQTVRSRAEYFLHMVKDSFKKSLDEVTLDNVQAAALIGNICGIHGDTVGESLFFGISFRMCHILRLPEPSQEDDNIMREIKIRTYWSLYMIDQWSSAGLDVPRQIPDTN